MGTILYVHGTGVRSDAYQAALQHVSAGITRIRPEWRVAPCYWGDAHGVRLNAGGISIPGVSDRGPAPVEDDSEIAVWWALERDPLYELRVLALSEVGQGDLPPTAELPGEWISELALRLPEGRMADLIENAGLGEVFPAAVREVLADESCGQALAREHELGDALITALARAFVAQSLRAADEQCDYGFPLDGDSRDEIVDAVVSALGGKDRGVGAVAYELAMRAGLSRMVDRRRSAWSEAAAPAAGDVLHYLTHGSGLREYIASRIIELDGPVVVLAHSLGGIAALELLIERPMPNVEHLVTVGSQAPLLYELDALTVLRYGEQLPDTVPEWSNVYDRRDLLAYVGAKLFDGRVHDFAVDNKAPFPRAHSAYFAKGNKRFYQLLDKILA